LTVSDGIVLVHGYSGSPVNIEPLAGKLEAIYGADSVRAVCLPGHGSGKIPIFDRQAFVASVVDAVDAFREKRQNLIILGHSTGGTIALAALAERSITPDLLILASTPKKIDTAYLERWSGLRSGRQEIPFSSVANMVSLINAAGSRRLEASFPVVVLHGDDDELVPFKDAYAWGENFNGPVRTVIIPGAGHDLFLGRNSAVAADVVIRTVTDNTKILSKKDADILGFVYAVEPEVTRFITCSPSSGRHLAASPSGRAAAGLTPALSPQVSAEPIIANIEITTRCNLRCAYCARTIRGTRGADMSKETFNTILGLLPHAYRITLVGLGETLLHPQAAEFVAEAASRGRRVALVTNGMLLDEAMSRELLKAGLESIAFSIDGATQELASTVRAGTDLGRVAGNIRKFVELSRATRGISTAVFSAVSVKTVSSLARLMDMIADLDVHVMMLSDLNFRENLDQTLWKNIDDTMAAHVRQGVAQAFKKDLPVLSVRGLEEFGLWKRYGKFLLLPPDQLYCRSDSHAWCHSPWQTIPVNVRGEVTLCDCQPEVPAGDLLTQPLSEIWNGEKLLNHRRRMLSNDPPAACRICPRF
jgi:MoaA/NifB/PqqE/SkfB family radical SAM enzyme/surfactin synthase thioesterase subunit